MSNEPTPDQIAASICVTISDLTPDVQGYVLREVAAQLRAQKAAQITIAREALSIAEQDAKAFESELSHR